MTNLEWISSAAFIALMLKSRATWDCLEGQTINHKVYGEGIVLEVQATDSGGSVMVRFSEDVKTAKGNNRASFPIPQAFSQGFIDQVAVSEELRARLAEAAKQPAPVPVSKPAEKPRPVPASKDVGARRRHLRQLKVKYHIEGYAVRWPEDQLYEVLRAFEEGRYDQVDEGLLIREQLHPLLAVFYEKRGLRAKASSEWRKANKPQWALDVTRDCNECAQTAELTARGAALRQLDRLEEAEFCARKAIRLTNPTSSYPWNLLGAVMVQIGNIEEAEACFRKAAELGGGERDRDWSIKSAVELVAEPDQQRQTALYFYNQDPGRYAWAKAYLVGEDEEKKE